MSRVEAESTSTAGQIGQSVESHLSSAMAWIVFGAVLVAFALRLTCAAGTYLNSDEALHHLIANQKSLIAAYRASLATAHPPLYFLFLYYWRLVGDSEFMLRLPSALASSAAAWVAYRWIEIVLGRVAGLIGLFVLAFSPVLTTLAAEVRNYSMLLLCMASALYFLERAFRDQTVSAVVYSSLFLYLAILTHYSALWFALSIGVYALLRIFSLNIRARIAWLLFQLCGLAIYVWLYVVHVSKLRGGSLEAFAMTGWLNAHYFRGGESPVNFVRSATKDLFHFLTGSIAGGNAALIIFVAGVLWLLATALLRHRRDLAAFGLLLLLPFVFGMIGSLLNLYPYGGTRHCIYLVLFATAGVSFPLATVFRQRLLPVLLLAVLVLPYWYRHHLPDPLQMDREQQRKELMSHVIEDLRHSVQPNEPVFSDYQASLLLEYYLGRNDRQPAPRECGGVTEAQYGPYKVVAVGDWSATPDQFVTGLDGWQKSCDSARRESVWIFDGGWGVNLLDDLSRSSPESISEARRYGESLSLFRFRIDR